MLYLPPDDNRFFNIYQAERPIALMDSSPSDLYYVLEDWEKGLLLYTDDLRERWYGVQLPNTTGKSRIIALEVMVERVFVIANPEESRAGNPLIASSATELALVLPSL
ncbi:MAG: hypothetical protein QXS54_08470 [Candidatus Methanomethylicaceae archaeon]